MFLGASSKYQRNMDSNYLIFQRLLLIVIILLTEVRLYVLCIRVMCLYPNNKLI